jgi:hypothetical protein
VKSLQKKSFLRETLFSFFNELDNFVFAVNCENRLTEKGLTLFTGFVETPLATEWKKGERKRERDKERQREREKERKREREKEK